MTGAHGIRGGLRVRYFGDDLGHFSPEADLQFRFVDGSAQSHTVERVVPGRAGEIRLFLADLSDRSIAESFKGAEIFATREGLEVLPEGEFYWFELVGCEVVTDSGRTVGKVRELWAAGSQDLLVVDSDSGEEILIPTAEAIIPEINLEEKRIRVVDLPGLIEPAHIGGKKRTKTSKEAVGGHISPGDGCVESTF